MFQRSFLSFFFFFYLSLLPCKLIFTTTTSRRRRRRLLVPFLPRCVCVGILSFIYPLAECQMMSRERERLASTDFYSEEQKKKGKKETRTS